MERPTRDVDEIAGLQNDLTAIAAIAARLDTTDPTGHDVPADVIIGVVVRRIRLRARDQHRAPHHRVRAINGLVADAEAHPQRRLVAGIDADLALSDDRDALFLERNHLLAPFMPIVRL
jgi:hypothetical protein